MHTISMKNTRVFCWSRWKRPPHPLPQIIQNLAHKKFKGPVVGTNGTGRFCPALTGTKTNCWTLGLTYICYCWVVAVGNDGAIGAANRLFGAKTIIDLSRNSNFNFSFYRLSQLCFCGFLHLYQLVLQNFSFLSCRIRSLSLKVFSSSNDYFQ